MSKVIGIDLGTTFSAIASLDDLGNPEVLASIEDNRKITASAVYLKDNEVIVGDKALNYLKDQSNNVILQTKREMENDVVYSTDEGKWVTDKDLVDAYTPAQVSSLILKKLKEYTSDVKKVVITVPAMFAEKARQATLDAAKIADLEVIELINEPTAAVLHYASLPGVEVGGRVMIFDLGGGTFDVTFAEVKNKKVDVMTSRGDKYLGGRDFDKEITKLMKKKYFDVHNVEIDIENNKEYIHKAEEVKKILSVKDKANIEITGPKGPQKIEITQEEFEESIQTYIEKIKMLIEEAMEASGMNPSRINQTLLVGGSTRMPIITKVLTQMMGKPPVKGVNVDEAVVCGAAIYAGLKTEKETLSDQQQEALKEVNLTDVCVDRLRQFLPFVSERCSSLGEIFNAASFLFDGVTVGTEKSLSLLDDRSKEIIKSFATSIGSTQLKWEANYLETFINSYCDENKLKFRDIGLPLRIIITGSKSSPSIVHIMEILGEDEILNRLNIATS